MANKDKQRTPDRAAAATEAIRRDIVRLGEVSRWKTHLKVNGRDIEAVMSDDFLMIIEEIWRPIDPKAVDEDPDAFSKRQQALFGKLAEILGVTMEDLDGVVAVIPRIYFAEDDPNFLIEFGQVLRLSTLQYGGHSTEDRLKKIPDVTALATIGRTNIITGDQLIGKIIDVMGMSKTANTLILPSLEHPEIQRYRTALEIMSLFAAQLMTPLEAGKE